MDPPPASDLEKIEDQKDGGPSFHCDLYDTEVVHKIAQAFLPGLATACVDNTTGDIFRSPGSVAADIRKEMIDYLTRRSESFVAEHIVLEGGLEIEASNDPYETVSDFIDDFATSKRNLFSRVSGWMLSERREDNIDDFAQEMEISGFWLTDHREGIAQTLLRNVDFKNSSHCEMKFQIREELAEHAMNCGYRTKNCENEGCNAVFCARTKENHDSVCPFKIIPCEQNCSESIMRREMDRHCITVCPMKLVNCPFHAVGCLSDVHQCEVQQHHVENVSSHLMYILRSIYKEASPDDLKPRAEQIQQLSSRLSEARNARALTNLVKEIDAKLGPLEIKPKNSTDSESDKPENTEKKALEEAQMKEKTETGGSSEQSAREASGDEVVSKKAAVLVDDSKVSEAEIAENVNEEGELKAQKLLEIGEFIKEGDSNSGSDLSERTETKAPEVVVMDEDREEEEEESAETKHSRKNETRGLDTEVNDVIDEDNRETKKSNETKAPEVVVMDENREEEEEGAETKQSRTNESRGLDIEVNDVIDEDNRETKKSNETKAPEVVVMDENREEEEEKGGETKHSQTNETRGLDIEGNEVIDEDNRETKKSTETETETGVPSRTVMEGEEETERLNLKARASDEAEALSKSSEGFSTTQAETVPNMS